MTIARILRSMPKGLTAREIARRTGWPYETTRGRIARNHYAAADGRRFSQNGKRRFDSERADWSKSNVELARQFGVTRERVRVIRKRLGKPHIESRGRKPIVREIP